MILTDTMAAVRVELERAGLVVKESVNARIVFAHYYGTPGEAINVEASVTPGGLHTLTVGRRNGRARQTTFRELTAGGFNWPAIVGRVKQRLDSIRARKHAEADDDTQAAERAELHGMVKAQLDDAPDADPSVAVFADGRVRITIEVGRDEALEVAARIADIIKTTGARPVSMVHYVPGFEVPPAGTPDKD